MTKSSMARYMMHLNYVVNDQYSATVKDTNICLSPFNTGIKSRYARNRNRTFADAIPLGAKGTGIEG